MTSYFFSQVEQNTKNSDFLKRLEAFAYSNKKLIYVLDRPLTDQKYSYKYSQALIILSPKNKISIIDYGNKKEEFLNYVEDIIEDISSISDKYLYKNIIGRSRVWRSTLFETDIRIETLSNISEIDRKRVV